MTRNDRPGEGRPVQGPGEGLPTSYLTKVNLFGDAQESTGVIFCDICHRPTFRLVGSDGRPRHSWCEPRHVGVTDPDTSRRAARRTRKGPGSPLAQAILAALAEHGPMTDAEILEHLPTGTVQGSAVKRRLDLCRAGLVVETARRRPTPTGTPAIVWRVTDKGSS